MKLAAALSLFYVGCLVPGYAAADEKTAATGPASFRQAVAPFLQAHCVSCHGKGDPEGSVSLVGFTDSARVQENYELWEQVVRMLSDRKMPPKGEPRPDERELRAAVNSLQAELVRFDCTQQNHPGRVTLHRLNRAEYNNTIRDLTGVDFQPADDFPSDDVGNGFDNMGDVLSISPILLEKYFAAAEAIADKVLADKSARRRIFAVQPSEKVDRVAAARRNLQAFATRAFRRPVDDAEFERLFELLKSAYQQGCSDEEILKVALEAILSSPHFLFRVEADPAPDDEDHVRELDDYEIATRLSYFLWSTMPDDELFQLAGEGKLHEPDNLRHQVARMLHDPKSQALVKNFAGQWLQLRNLTELSPDHDRFPTFDEDLRAAMRRETELFFEAMIREDRSVLEFLDADYTFVNEKLARHYGIDGVKGPEFRRVTLPHQRRGVLTQASILTLTSNPTRTSPVKRGKWILENILGEPPPPPPAGVPPLDAQAETLGSLRERMEQHRANEACAVCHRQMDALGFGLENFNAVGAWRDRDGRFAIDASGTLPNGRTFNGPAELVKILVDDKQDAFCHCLARKMLTYALGRGLLSYDRCAVDTITKRLAADGYRFSALVSAVVLSDPFLKREAGVRQ